ncbi:MAG: hypothetical protein JSS29_18090 [Proteobacteria bacterium]|nr:hypothetical protein [Pseudomonadota bacterium]
MTSEDLQIWLNHFEHHALHLRSIPAELADNLSDEERRLIARSIATFQLGEQSEGRTLVRAAQRFAQARAMPHLVRIVELFIREEQRHAALLKEFMEDHGIALRQAHWSDWVFRRVRRVAGFELYLHVLVCAELIGNVYYRALEAATECTRLRILCRVLVCEELAHIGFESQLLLGLQRSRPAPVRLLMRTAHRAFIASAACVVWFTHRDVLRRAGYRRRTFLSSCLAQHTFYLEPTPAGGLRELVP